MRPGDPLVGQTLDDRYEIIRRVARGGMATVFEATDLRLGRTVAVKVMHSGLDDADAFAARFDAEARAAALLAHPSVVSVFDQGIDGNRPYIVMEYVKGVTLRRLITREAPFHPLRVLDLLEPVASALAAAHAADLVHRDVKPENVLISERGHVKVADFGLARSISAQSAAGESEMVIGTVSYIAPELVQRGHADPRSDVYSLGIIMFEMLTGEKPHRGATPLEVAYSHVHNETPTPSSMPLARSVPDYLDALVAAACARVRVDRPADAEVFLSHLRQAREALARGVTSDADLVRLMGETHLPALAAASAASAGEREVRFTPGFIQTPTFEQYTDGIPYYSDGDPSPLSPLSPVTRPVPVIGPRSGWQRSPIHRLRRALAALVVLVVLGGVGGFGWWAAVGRLAPVPAVAGLTRAQAEASASGAGLSVVVVEEHSEQTPAGDVTRTDPAQGGRIEPGGRLTLYVSLGQERFAVPTLTGLSEADARAALSGLDLAPGTVTEAYSASVPAGAVISQGTPAGQLVRRGDRVDFVLSQGGEPVALPDLRGVQAVEARRQLEGLGLRHRTTAVFSAGVPKGAVVSQRPGPSEVHRGDTISIVISLGPVGG